jgi:hypothetical protein
MSNACEKKYNWMYDRIALRGLLYKGIPINMDRYLIKLLDARAGKLQILHSCMMHLLLLEMEAHAGWRLAPTVAARCSRREPTNQPRSLQGQSMSQSRREERECGAIDSQLIIWSTFVLHRTSSFSTGRPDGTRQIGSLARR